jgi:hypothetical protein
MWDKRRIRVSRDHENREEGTDPISFILKVRASYFSGLIYVESSQQLFHIFAKNKRDSLTKRWYTVFVIIRKFGSFLHFVFFVKASVDFVSDIWILKFPGYFLLRPEVGTIDKIIDKSIIDNYRILKTLSNYRFTKIIVLSVSNH